MKQLICLAGMMSVICNAWAEEVRVTPYRPTVTNSAGLSAPGWVELEAGYTQQNEAGASRQSIQYLTKLAMTPDFGVLIAGDAYVRQSMPNQPVLSGFGDTGLFLKHHVLVEEETATELGWEYGFKAPTAANGLGSGKTDYVLNGIFSRDFGAHELDANLNVTKLGNPAPGEGAYQYGWSATVFRMVDERMGVMCEVSGIARNRTTPEQQWLVAANYFLNTSLVVDVGYAAGFGSTANRHMIFVGMAVLLGRFR